MEIQRTAVTLLFRRCRWRWRWRWRWRYGFKSAQVLVPSEADAPAHPDVPDGDDEAQEGQEPGQAPRGRGRQRLLHVLPPGKVREAFRAAFRFGLRFAPLLLLLLSPLLPLSAAGACCLMALFSYAVGA